MERIRKEYPEYRMAIVHVTASDETIRLRVKSRAEKSGRDVPSDLLEKSISQVPKSVKALSPCVDVTFTIRNEDEQPIQLIPNNKDNIHVDDEEEKEISEAWEKFRATWWKDISHDDNELPPWCDSFCPGISQMEQCVFDTERQQAACRVWSEAYPSFCPRCALVGDTQCGICIHDMNWCKCPTCGPGAVCSSQS